MEVLVDFHKQTTVHLSVLSASPGWYEPSSPGCLPDTPCDCDLPIVVLRIQAPRHLASLLTVDWILGGEWIKHSAIISRVVDSVVQHSH